MTKMNKKPKPKKVLKYTIKAEIEIDADEPNDNLMQLIEDIRGMGSADIENVELVDKVES